MRAAAPGQSSSALRLRLGGRSDGRLAVGTDLLHVEVVIEFVDLHLVHGGEQGVGGVGSLSLCDLLEGETVGEQREGLVRLHVESRVLVEPPIEYAVGDAGGIELLLEPLLRSEGEDLFQVAGAGAKGEAVEELLSSLLLG